MFAREKRKTIVKNPPNARQVVGKIDKTQQLEKSRWLNHKVTM